MLMAATVPQVPDLSTLAAPLGLAALSMRRNGAVTVPQRVWTGAVLLGTALLASYPWLREEPLAGAMSLLGLPPGSRLWPRGWRWCFSGSRGSASGWAAAGARVCGPSGWPG